MSDELNWKLRGSCREHDPDTFFPVGNGGPTARQERAAKQICHDCPVMRECLQYALDTKQEYGVWGGASERELRNMRKAPNRRHRQQRVGHKIELSHFEVETILSRLDAGGTYPQVEREVRVGRDVCERVWREHRSSAHPPYRSKAREAAR